MLFARLSAISVLLCAFAINVSVCADSDNSRIDRIKDRYQTLGKLSRNGKKQQALKKLKADLELKINSNDTEEKLLALSDLAVVNLYLDDPNSSDPNNAVAIAGRLLNDTAGRFERKGKVDKRAYDLTYSIAQECYLKGNAMASVNKEVEAEKLYQASADIVHKAISLSDDSEADRLDSYVLMADCMKNAKKYGKAAKYYQQILELNDKSSDDKSLSTYYDLPALYRKMAASGKISQGECFSKSIEVYNLLESRFSTNGEVVKEAKLRKCRLCKKMKQWLKLSDNCQEYLNLFGEKQSAEVLYLQGLALVNVSQYSEAKEVLTKCIESSSVEEGFKFRSQKLLDSLQKKTARLNSFGM